ncbi:uncharacterized protein LOC112589456 [Harpegnathos saltator]|uniref:uncharacterized protein LOC112589456 n=1 Tax=Harpegnathos saltator TaxID=610380 RepID=UPI000DBEDDF1|nr:uncharacterized protein LOC112589456 [Harpegnathos saltator]
MEENNFTWDDATTKLFLEIYKRKKDLVSTRKIKTYTILWKHIAEDMRRKGYSVTALQVENKLKSLLRLYKNVMSNNKKTGRERKICNFEAELIDIFGKKHNIAPLALSGRTGLLLREPFSDVQNDILLDDSINNEEPINTISAISAVSNISGAAAETSNDIPHIVNKNRFSQKMKVKGGTTAEYLKKCQLALDTYISEIRSERQNNESIQLQILEEYKDIKKIQDDFVKSAKQQWAIINAREVERNRILAEIASHFYNENC